MKYLLKKEMCFLFSCAMTLLSVPVHAEQPQEIHEQPVMMTNSHQWDMTSATGHRYRIFMYVPSGRPPREGYPVMYMTDANALFPLASQLSNNFGHRPDHSGGAGMVIVGIGYPPEENVVNARSRDLTPPLPKQQASAVTMHPQRENGKAESFYQFVETQVKPMVQKQTQINQHQQYLFGHSFGALWALYVLAHHPQAYSRYMVASPSLWWDKGTTAKAVVHTLAQQKSELAPISVLLMVSQYEETPAPWATPPHGKTLAAMARIERQRDQIGRSHQLAKQLSALPDIHVEYKIFPDEDHGTEIAGALSDAIRFGLLKR